jgi:hypothetical protein
MKFNLNKIDFKTITIIILIIVILLLRMCQPHNDDTGKHIKVDGKTYQVLKHTVDTIYVPVTKTVFKKGETIFKEKTIYVNIPNKIDTLSIIKNYYSQNIYKDTLKMGDSLGYVSIVDTIFNNKIESRTWDSHINKMVIKETTIVKDLPKIRLYLGGNISITDKYFIHTLIPTILIKTKKEKIYSIGVGIDTKRNIYYQGGFYLKI